MVFNREELDSETGDKINDVMDGNSGGYLGGNSGGYQSSSLQQENNQLRQQISELQAKITELTNQCSDRDIDDNGNILLNDDSDGDNNNDDDDDNNDDDDDINDDDRNRLSELNTEAFMGSMRKNNNILSYSFLNKF